MPAEIPPIISVDDHVVEPPDLFERWLPERWRTQGPRVVRAPWEAGEPRRGGRYYRAASGRETDFWIYEDLEMAITNQLASAGLPPDKIVHEPIAFADMRPGCYEPGPRLADMDRNHVERSLCFPTFPRFCGQTFLDAHDKELALACVHAYNNWMVDEWCGDSGGRLIPLCLIPLWDPNLAAAEVRRNAERSVRAVAFSELPAKLDLPSIHDKDRRWDPFFAACAETHTVLCMHIGSSSQVMLTSADAPIAVAVALLQQSSQASLADWLFSGVLARFPKLKLAYSEGQIGWIPYVLERCDRIWADGYQASKLPAELTEPPSTYVRGRVYGCFFEDDYGLRNRDLIGIEQITFESDYPHQDSTWPNTRAYAEKAMAGLDAWEVDRIVRANAIEMLELDPTLPGARADA